jgi:hypothetical protein
VQSINQPPTARDLNQILARLYQCAIERALEASQRGDLEEFEVLPGDLAEYAGEIEKGSGEGASEFATPELLAGQTGIAEVQDNVDGRG